MAPPTIIGITGDNHNIVAIISAAFKSRIIQIFPVAGPKIDDQIKSELLDAVMSTMEDAGTRLIIVDKIIIRRVADIILEQGGTIIDADLWYAPRDRVYAPGNLKGTHLKDYLRKVVGQILDKAVTPPTIEIVISRAGGRIKASDIPNLEATLREFRFVPTFNEELARKNNIPVPNPVDLYEPVTLRSEPDVVYIIFPRFSVAKLISMLDRPVTEVYKNNILLDLIPDLPVSGFYDYQIEAAKKIVVAHLNPVAAEKHMASCVLNMDPGTGKTYIACLLIMMLRQRAVYICHRESIRDQTADVFISRGLRVSKTLDDAANSDIDVVILIVNTAAKADIGAFSHFGFAIYDEVHHYCSPEFSKVLSKSRSKYNLCMSASTDERADGLDVIYHVHHGPTVTGRDLGVEGKIYHFDIEFTILKNNWGPEINYVARGATNMRSYWAGVKNLNRCIPRRNLLMYYLGQLLSRGHSVYIMAHETETVNLIAGLIEIAHSGTGMARLTSRTAEEIKIAYSRDNEIIVATYKYVIEGISIPHMTGLIFWDPPLPSNVKQALGRILRPGPEQNKKREVIDLVDEGSMFERWFDQGNSNHSGRLEHYKKLLAKGKAS